VPAGSSTFGVVSSGLPSLFLIASTSILESFSGSSLPPPEAASQRTRPLPTDRPLRVLELFAGVRATTEAVARLGYSKGGGHCSHFQAHERDVRQGVLWGSELLPTIHPELQEAPVPAQRADQKGNGGVALGRAPEEGVPAAQAGTAGEPGVGATTEGETLQGGVRLEQAQSWRGAPTGRQEWSASDRILEPQLQSGRVTVQQL
jgi:hypothetical protein